MQGQEGRTKRIGYIIQGKATQKAIHSKALRQCSTNTRMTPILFHQHVVHTVNHGAQRAKILATSQRPPQVPGHVRPPEFEQNGSGDGSSMAFAMRSVLSATIAARGFWSGCSPDLRGIARLWGGCQTTPVRWRGHDGYGLNGATMPWVGAWDEQPGLTAVIREICFGLTAAALTSRRSW